MGKFVGFGNFARIASLCAGFHLVHLHYMVSFSLKLLAKFEFPPRSSNKTCIDIFVILKFSDQSRAHQTSETDTRHLKMSSDRSEGNSELKHEREREFPKYSLKISLLRDSKTIISTASYIRT